MSELNTAYIAGLVLRSKANDSDAFAELYAMTYNKVYNYTRHYLKDNDLAQDAWQEVYVLVLKNLHKLNDPTLFIAWLNRITFHVCYDINQKYRLGNSQPMASEDLEIISPVSSADNPEEIYQNKESLDAINQALNALPFHEKEVVIMRYFNNMKLEEIANSIDVSLSSVKRYLVSAQKKLKKILNN